MFELGRLAVKIAGRDAGKKCVVVDILENGRVLIDGETRRKPCNLKHLEPLPHILPIQRDISHEDLKKELKKVGIDIRETKPKAAAPQSAAAAKSTKEQKPEEKKQEKKKKAKKANTH